jgi:Zinc finger, C3HC4 type (RING finger)
MHNFFKQRLDGPKQLKLDGAVESGNMAEIRHLLKSGARTDVRPEVEGAILPLPVLRALLNGDTAALQLLFKQFDINNFVDCWHRPLDVAAIMDDINLVRNLIASGAAPSPETLALAQSEPVIKELLLNGALLERLPEAEVRRLACILGDTAELSLPADLVAQLKTVVAEAAAAECFAYEHSSSKTVLLKAQEFANMYLEQDNARYAEYLNLSHRQQQQVKLTDVCPGVTAGLMTVGIFDAARLRRPAAATTQDNGGSTSKGTWVPVGVSVAAIGVVACGVRRYRRAPRGVPARSGATSDQSETSSGTPAVAPSGSAPAVPMADAPASAEEQAGLAALATGPPAGPVTTTGTASEAVIVPAVAAAEQSIAVQQLSPDSASSAMSSSTAGVGLGTVGVGAMFPEALHIVIDRLQAEKQAQIIMLQNRKNKVLRLEGRIAELQVQLREQTADATEGWQQYRDVTARLEEVEAQLQSVSGDLEVTERELADALDGVNMNFCLVCQSTPSTVYYKPCMHLCICAACRVEYAVMKCLYCRAAATDAVTVFKV